MPDTITNPRVKFKQAIVKSNYMKEQLEKLIKMKEEKAASKSNKNSLEQGSLDDQKKSSII